MGQAFAGTSGSVGNGVLAWCGRIKKRLRKSEGVRCHRRRASSYQKIPSYFEGKDMVVKESINLRRQTMNIRMASYVKPYPCRRCVIDR
jgi:hypothetical protein